MGVVEVSLTPVVNLPQMHVESVNPKSYGHFALPCLADQGTAHD